MQVVVALVVFYLVGDTLFALFVIWVVTCYTTMYWLAWNGRSRERVLPTEMEEHGMSGCKHAWWGHICAHVDDDNNHRLEEEIGEMYILLVFHLKYSLIFFGSFT